MIDLIKWLENANQEDSKVRAVLRHSLSFDPGNYPAAFPYVEWALNDDDNSWRRTVNYLVAGLWAQHWREGRTASMSIGKACATHQVASGSTSTERRFIVLLDSDSDQLPHRLRQMVALLKDQPIDFESLRKGLLSWNDDQKRTRNQWARDFYGNLNHDSKTETITIAENAE